MNRFDLNSLIKIVVDINQELLDIFVCFCLLNGFFAKLRERFKYRTKYYLICCQKYPDISLKVQNNTFIGIRKSIVCNMYSEKEVIMLD